MADTKPRWWHRKSGGTYTELHRGKLQASGDLDLAPVVVYQGEADGRVWVRPVAEFEDGRFERIHSKLASPAPQWIRAAEQRAPAHQTVLVALKNGAVTTGELVGQLGWHWEETDDEPEGNHVTHWMPLPAAPPT